MVEEKQGMNENAIDRLGRIRKDSQDGTYN
jgi:hypothetical protein